MQGVADVAIRLQQKTDIQSLITILPTLPKQPFHILTTFLENTRPSLELTEALAQQLDNELKAETPDIGDICACLRAISNVPETGLLNNMVAQILRHDCSRHIEVMAVIAGRCWKVLAEPERCRQFIEKLAQNEMGYDGFSHLLADLIYLPDMRMPVMAALRHPERSKTLQQYVGQLFSH